MSRYTAWDTALARGLIESLASLPGATLPILHALQEEFGYVDRAAIPLIADALNLSHAEIHGVISFYPDFHDALPSERVIKLCRAEACQALGCEALVDHARDNLGLRIDAAAPHRRVQIETVYCLGNCALGPSALVEGALIGRLDAELLSELCDGAEVDA
jgi:formate dehydrogenase subunit gamma